VSIEPGWESVIGLEIHVQLATQSKLFTAASTQYGAPPNTHVDPVTLGMPGVLPVLNREAVELAMRLGIALGCEIDRKSRFARKHYFYPDLPKGYQISQLERPICNGGQITIEVDGVKREVRLNRIHLEEDAGKLVHEADRDRSLVDYNRAGVSLVETVSEPEMSTSAEAVAYMRALHQIVVALGVSDGNMEEGNFRCDANVSVRPVGQEELGTRTELKNINSFRFVGRAIDYEIDRQIAHIESGGVVVQETRLWDDEAGVSRALRSKEEAHDYRYFPDPDLTEISIDEAWYERVRTSIPELPAARRERFVSLGLSEYDADVLTQSKGRADYFEAVCVSIADGKLVANWIQGELLGALNAQGKEIEDSPVSAESLAELLGLVADKTVSSKMAKSCFSAMFSQGVSPSQWVQENGGQITDTSAIEVLVREVIEGNPGQVSEYLGGKEKLLGFFVGRVMQATRGKANPQMVNELARRLLEERRT
jgi:aspartyl-tRNA(Asn)/glutamyl-tRNA(Gln) amidotransferase subunit B